MPEREGEPRLPPPPAPPLFRADEALAPSASVPEPLPWAAADSVPIPRWNGADIPLSLRSTGDPMPRSDACGTLTGSALAGSALADCDLASGADFLISAREDVVSRVDPCRPLRLSPPPPRRSRSLEERRGDSGLPGAWRDDLPADALSSTAPGDGDGRHLPPPLPPPPTCLFSSSLSTLLSSI